MEDPTPTGSPSQKTARRAQIAVACEFRTVVRYIQDID
jgi:hypothetical protein